MPRTQTKNVDEYNADGHQKYIGRISDIFDKHKMA